MHIITRFKAVITQQPNEQFPNRKSTFTFPLMNEFEMESSWACLSDTGKLKLPKNIWVKNQDNVSVNLGGSPGGANNTFPINADYGNHAPLFFRGDSIRISYGYSYPDSAGNWKTQINELPARWITSVGNKMPIEIEFCDNMYLLKQTQAPNKVWPAATYTMEQMITELLGVVNTRWNVNLTLSSSPSGSTTNIGDFRTQNETVCQVLERLQKDYKIESFFRGEVLHSGLIAYYPEDINTESFAFQRNILTDELSYKRADDIQLSLHAYSVNKAELQTTTKSGRLKTKSTRLQVTVGIINGQYVGINPADKNAPLGQMRTMYFWNIPTVDALKQKAIEALHRLYYEGYRGKFTTLALPFVQHGDQVTIQDKRLPERTSTHFVKSVKYYGSVSQGLRQEIELDMRIDGVLSPEQIAAGI